MSEGKALLAELVQCGVRVERSPDDPQKLRISPPGKLDPRMMARLKAVKDEILLLISPTGDSDTTPENIRNLLGSVATMRGRLKFFEAEAWFCIDLRETPSRDVRAVLEIGGLLQSSRSWLLENLPSLVADNWIEVVPPAAVPSTPGSRRRNFWRWN